MRFKFVFSAEWPSLPQCLALCLNIIIHSFFRLNIILGKDLNKENLFEFVKVIGFMNKI